MREWPLCDEPGEGTICCGAGLAAAQSGHHRRDRRPRTVEQLRQILKAPSLRLSSEALAKLGLIWPDPGGEAPVAYAW